jgi:hypothetical protein
MCLRFVVVRSGRSWGRMLYSGPTCKEMNDKSVKRNQKTLRREPRLPARSPQLLVQKEEARRGPLDPYRGRTCDLGVISTTL